MLCNVIKHRGGLEAALAASLVENLIGLLDDGRPAEVQRKASKTLAIACFDDMAKIIAIQVQGATYSFYFFFCLFFLRFFFLLAFVCS